MLYKPGMSLTSSQILNDTLYIQAGLKLQSLTSANIKTPDEVWRLEHMYGSYTEESVWEEFGQKRLGQKGNEFEYILLNSVKYYESNHFLQQKTQLRLGVDQLRS